MKWIQKRLPKTALCGLALAAIIAAGTFAGRTAAYFTDTKTENAVFTFGDVAIVLHEPSFEQDGPPSVPNQEIPKDPIVRNNGTKDCVAFMTVTVPVETFIALDDNQKPSNPTPAPVYYLKSETALPSDHQNSFNDGWILLETHQADNTVTYLLGFNQILPPSSEQIKNIDDPVEIMKLNSATTPAFSKIQLCNFLENTLSGNYTVRVNAYAIQADGITDGISGEITASVLSKIWADYGSNI